MKIKIRHNGQKLQVKVLGPEDTITGKCLQTWGKPENLSSDGIRWYKSEAIGEKVSQHPGRTYVEVLSKFF